ncbi:MAG TPA: ABC transporter ATP-binding protein, partial [Opitutaceae bacterium]
YFRKLQLLPLSFLQRQTTGDLISRGLADTNQLQSSLTAVANDGVKQPATLIGALITVAWISYHQNGSALTMASLAIVPICVFPVRYIGKKLVKRAYQMQTQLGSLTNTLNENLSAAKEVRAFGLQDRQARMFANETSALISVQLKVAKYSLALAPSIEIVSAFGIAIVFVYAYLGHVGLNAFLPIITALFFSYDAIKRLGAINNEVKRGEAALNRLEVVFNEPVTIQDPPHPANIGRAKGDISFSDVTFSYKAEEPVLRGVSIDIPQGTVCALVGPSGAGKTTFANLVPRFFDVETGRVSIDSIDIRQMRLGDLRRNIAIVSQDPVLFNDTVYNNLLLGRLDATPEEVKAAARDAHADEFISAFPQGYDTVVGERGARLSGGQKQRLAVARAFLRNAPILILDEATSALDSQSEQMIQDALRKLVVGKTVLIIAHRFSTIRDASLILVFDQGSIVAQGNHGQLYADNGLYRELYDRQRTEVI